VNYRSGILSTRAAAKKIGENFNGPSSVYDCYQVFSPGLTGNYTGKIREIKPPEPPAEKKFLG
jgi:hypothetical protein